MFGVYQFCLISQEYYLYIFRFCVGDRFFLCDNKILCEYDYEERMVFANLAYNSSNLASQVRINYFSLFQKHVFIFKMGFRMSFYFQNVVCFQNVLSFSKCERFCVFFPFSEKHNCKQKSVHSLQIALLMRLC